MCLSPINFNGLCHFWWRTVQWWPIVLSCSDQWFVYTPMVFNIVYFLSSGDACFECPRILNQLHWGLIEWKSWPPEEISDTDKPNNLIYVISYNVISELSSPYIFFKIEGLIVFFFLFLFCKKTVVCLLVIFSLFSIFSHVSNRS